MDVFTQQLNWKTLLRLEEFLDENGARYGNMRDEDDDVDILSDIIKEVGLPFVFYDSDMELGFSLFKKCLLDAKGRHNIRSAVREVDKCDDDKVYSNTALAFLVILILICKCDENGRKRISDAIETFAPHKELMLESYPWNYIMGIAYFSLQQEIQAFEFLTRANELKANCEDTAAFRSDCIERLTNGTFIQNFRQRVLYSWLSFIDAEESIRHQFDESKAQGSNIFVHPKCKEIFSSILPGIEVFISRVGFKYDLNFVPKFECLDLLKLFYLKQLVPDLVLKHWNISIESKGGKGNVYTVADVPVYVDDVEISLSEHKGKFHILASCPKLDRADVPNEVTLYIIRALLSNLLGDASCNRYISACDLNDGLISFVKRFISPKIEEKMALSELPNKLISRGVDLEIDSNDFIDSSIVCYRPYRKPDCCNRWRRDILAGSTLFKELNNDFIYRNHNFMIKLHKDGITAGFIAYSLDTFKGNDRPSQIFALRDEFEKFLVQDHRQDVAKIIGGATGIKYGYVDFIVWDFSGFLDAAKYFFEDKNIEKVYFHTFHSCTQTIMIKDGEKFPLAVVDDFNPRIEKFADLDDIEDISSEDLDDDDDLYDLNSEDFDDSTDDIVYEFFEHGYESTDGDSDTNAALAIELMIADAKSMGNYKVDESSSNFRVSNGQLFKPDADNDPNVELALLKCRYMQGSLFEHDDQVTLHEMFCNKQFSKCIKITEGVARRFRTTKSALDAAEILFSYSFKGDNLIKPPRYKGDRAILVAIAILKGIEDKCKYEGRWYELMAKCYSAIGGFNGKAVSYAKSYLDVAPDNDYAYALLEEFQSIFSRSIFPIYFQ